MILVNPVSKSSVITGKQLKSIVDKLTKDVHKISGTAGYSLAMCTSGGVSLEEIDLNTFQSKEYPHLYIVGEALDVDGDTGGYNLQFAFTSGYISAKHITSKL
jgi:predicted flavoprotein YhiN